MPPLSLRRHVIFETLQADLLEFQAQHDLDGGFFEACVLAERQRDILATVMEPNRAATLKGHADPLRMGPSRKRDRGDILAFDQIWPELGF